MPRDGGVVNVGPAKKWRKIGGPWLRRALAVTLDATGLVVVEQTTRSPETKAGSVCGADGNPTVSALSNPNFYIDSSLTDKLNSVYAGYTVRATNSETNLRLVLSDFTGNVVSLATDQSGEVTLPNLASNATHTAYFLLKASGPTTTPQTHTITLYRGDRVACTRTFTFTRVNETIKALANKVDSVTQSTSGTASLGDVITVVVEGRTGTIGAGPSFDPGVISYAPTLVIRQRRRATDGRQ